MTCADKRTGEPHRDGQANHHSTLKQSTSEQLPSCLRRYAGSTPRTTSTAVASSSLRRSRESCDSGSHRKRYSRSGGLWY